MNGLAGILLLASATVAFGQNALRVDLSGEWRWIAEDRQEFAGAAFDDSQWRTFGLPRGFQVPLAQYGDGRTVWMRRHGRVPAGTDARSLALTLGTVADVYEVWVNGQRVGHSGDFESFSEAHIPHPLTFDLPAEAIPANGELVIALRMRWALWTHPIYILEDRGPYLITPRSDAPRHAGAEQMALRRETLSLSLMSGTAFFLIAILSLITWWSDRDHREFFWFGCVSLAFAFDATFYNLTLTPATQPFNRRGIAVFGAVPGCLIYPLFTHFVATALGYRSRWLLGGLWVGWSLLPVATVFGFDQVIWSCTANLWIAGLAIGIHAHDWRRLRWGHLPLSNLFFRLLLFLQAVGFVELWTRYLLNYPPLLPEWYFLGPYCLWREDLFWLPVSTAILILMVRRIDGDRRERLRLAGELSAARTVQQLLLPGSSPSTSAFEMQAAYEPSQEVGGDFYWSRVEPEGALLVAVGDVSGKGLKAAMLVSVAVGALRNERSSAPGAVLAALNGSLVGHTGGGFVTCVCARFDPDGRVAVANAGHLAPFLNQVEIAVEPGLPLGIVAGVEYAETGLRMALGDQITLLSDGVVEAENAQRELFGFERTREMSGKSAGEIAAAAKGWGQNDDITVVTVRRNG